jgi:hypothetical protein
MQLDQVIADGPCPSGPHDALTFDYVHDGQTVCLPDGTSLIPSSIGTGNWSAEWIGVVRTKTVPAVYWVAKQRYRPQSLATFAVFTSDREQHGSSNFRAVEFQSDRNEGSVGTDIDATLTFIDGTSSRMPFFWIGSQ